MSIAICRVQKLKGAAAVAGMQIHNRREKETSNSNPDIDRSRTKENYSLIETSEKNFNVLADERIKQGYKGKKAIRKDAVRVVEALFTSDSVFFEGKTLQEQQRFFEDCLKWSQKRFGTDNIISAVVHMDEETPHLHVDFVPLTADGRLSAKSVLGGRMDLQQLQDDFYKSVGKPWGMDRGERADLDNPAAEKPRKHKTVAELKRETFSKLHEIERQTLEKEKEYKYLSEKEIELKGKYEALCNKYQQEASEFNKIVVQKRELAENYRDILEKRNQLARDYNKISAFVNTLEEKRDSLLSENQVLEWYNDNKIQINMANAKQMAELLNQNKLLKKSLGLLPEDDYSQISKALKDKLRSNPGKEQKK